MNMAQIQESASLFEVNVPEFKLLKQCRKELKLLKVCTVVFDNKNNFSYIFYFLLLNTFSATLGLCIFSSFMHKRLENNTMA